MLDLFCFLLRDVNLIMGDLPQHCSMGLSSKDY